MKLRMYLRGLGLGIMVSALVLLFGVKKQDGTMTDAEIRARAIELGMVDESTTLADAAKPEEEVKPEEVKPEEEVKSEEEADPKAAEEPEVIEEPEVVEEPAKPEAADTTETEKKEEPVKSEDSKKAEDTKDTDKNTDVSGKTSDKADSAKDKAEQEKDKTEPAKDTTDTKKDEVPENIKTSTKEYKLTIQGGYSSDRVAKILESAGVIDSASDFDKYLCDKNYDHRISTGTYTIPGGADYETIAKIITHSR